MLRPEPVRAKGKQTMRTPATATTPSTARPRWQRSLAALALLGLLSACGGGDDAPAVPTEPSTNQAPTARFSAPTEVVAGQPAVFDARDSSDPEGGSLRFAWQFGDGAAAGAAQVAHLYAAPGSYTARLVVQDGDGATAELTRSITVRAAAAATRTVPLAGRVTGLDGLPLAGVTVAVQGRSDAGSSAVTDADGRAALSAGAGVDVVLRLSRPGYTEQVKHLRLPDGVGADASFEASLMPRAETQTLADAAAGGTLVGADGASVQLPPAALVDAATGAAVTGAVEVTLTPVDVNAAAVAAFPGRFEGVNGDGSRVPIVSYGSTEFLFSQGGRPLQLKPGARATIQLPLYASQDLQGAALTAGASLPLWALDERSALWIHEGQGTLVAEAASPTGLAMRAEVGHFSWWNADLGFTPYRPKPRCINDVPGQYDSIFEQATLCKMLAEMDKPIPAQGRAALSAQAAAVARFALPALRVEADLPMTGGSTIDVPPGQDVLLTGSALNGTWRGQLRVRGGEGVSDEVSVPMRPVTTGGSSEAITLPFDEVRAAAQMFRVDSYRFVATAGQDVELNIAASASSLSGRIRLRGAAGELLDGASFSSTAARLLVRLPAAGEYRIEVEPGSGAPGAYRLQAAFATLQTGPIGFEGADIRAPMVVAHQGSLLALWVAPDAAGNPQLIGTRSTAAAPAWSSPVRLAPVLGFNTFVMPPPHARADGSGTAWVLWFDAINKVPMLTRGALATDAAWAEPLALASEACRGTGVQRLAVNARGQAIVMWQRAGASAGQNDGWCSRRFDGGAWGAEQVLAPAAGQNFASSALHLVLTDAGQAVAAWNRNGISVPVVAQQDAADSAWSAPEVLDTTANDPLASGPSWNALAAAADGSLVLSWRSSGAGAANTSRVYAAVRPAGQAWSAPVALGDSVNGGLGYPQAGWLGGGRFAVVWNDAAGGPRLREYLGAAGWGAPQGLAGNAASPSSTSLWNLATAGDGSAAVVSQGLSPSAAGTQLFVDLRQPDTGNWRSTPATPAPSLVTGGYGPPVAADAGGAGLVWTETTGQGFQVRALRLPVGP
ncbi:hypothetical protein CLD22_05075 [Rubrivivax gelatinosus]|nr:hypothetical protein [Rubrivivax gelatinosus]